MSSQFTLSPVPYRPSAPLAGDESSCAYRGQNLKLRGLVPNIYWEAYAGSENLSEPIPSVAITGTIAFSTTTTTVTGTGTAFFDELHNGQTFLQANNGEVLVVAKVVTDTSFLASRLPTTTASGQTAVRCPNLFALGTNRGSQLSGNGSQWDKGTILSVGSGTLYLNGAILPGASLTATRRPQVALYDSSTQTYTVEDIGFDTVPNITNTNVTVVASGGTKNTSAGYYSFQVAYYSSITGGYGNPTDTLLQGGTDGYHVTVANSTFDFDFSGDTPPSKADGYIIYGSAFAGSVDISKVNAVQGGWFQIGQPIPFTSLTAGHWVFDYVDADLSILASFDNDTPPDAEFYGSLDRYPLLISTNGPGVGSGARQTTTNPGPYISPIKAENFDAYPNTFKVPTERGETIIGLVGSAGRVFVLTPNTLQAVTPTGLPAAPFTCRPFWKRGFQGAYNVAFVDDTLYGFTTAGVYRSIASGDEGSESHIFASDVEAQTATWHGGHVLVFHDPKNEEVCFIYSASSKNTDGYWESEILPYSLRQESWQMPVVLTSSTRDMIVTGAATVAGHLEFIAGGRRAATTAQFDTWRYDTNTTAVDVDYYVGWNFVDNGVELTAKTIRKLRPKGKFVKGATLQLYLTAPNTAIDVTDFEDGTNPTFQASVASSSAVTQYGVTKCRARNGMVWAARIEGTGDASQGLDQIHELALLGDVSGQER
jgi:hypothetical protein